MNQMKQSQHRSKAQMLPPDAGPQHCICGKLRAGRHGLMAKHPSSVMSLQLPDCQTNLGCDHVQSTQEDGLTWPQCLDKV